MESKDLGIRSFGFAGAALKMTGGYADRLETGVFSLSA